jgi:hypothetical protein
MAYNFFFKLKIFEIKYKRLSHKELLKKINFFFTDCPLLKTVTLPFTFLPLFENTWDESFFNLPLTGNFMKKFINLFEEFVGLHLIKKI